MMGSDKFYPEEKPVHEVTVDAFHMDKYEVTNAEYKKFVDDTGYITVAERPLNPADYPGADQEIVHLGPDAFSQRGIGVPSGRISSLRLGVEGNAAGGS